MTTHVRKWLESIQVFAFGELPAGADEWLEQLEDRSTEADVLIFADWLEEHGHAGCEFVRNSAYTFEASLRDSRVESELESIARDTQCSLTEILDIHSGQFDDGDNLNLLREICQLAHDAGQTPNMVLMVLRFPGSFVHFFDLREIDYGLIRRFRELAQRLRRARGVR